MYALAETLDPDDIYHISRFAYTELALSGVTAIGEFHYLHHDKGGVPYSDRLLLADAVIRAAQAAGIRMTLIRTAYMRAGFEQTLTPAQQRFFDPDVETILNDVTALRDRYGQQPLVRIGLAVHSVRAVPKAAIVELADYARQHHLPFHMHVAEQGREIEECLQEYNQRPVDLLAEAGVLDEHFVAVHATHLTASEIHQLGAANAFVCLCRTTERDLGDGLPETASLLKAGVKLCVGVDSHASSDAFEEIRAVELDDRSRTEARHVAATAPELLAAATKGGYESIGMGALWSEDTVSLKADDASLAGASDDLLEDAVIFGATPRAVDEVTVAGQRIVESGRHIHYDDALAGYEATLRKVLAR
jgi:formiminoglutamate deiminase